MLLCVENDICMVIMQSSHRNGRKDSVYKQHLYVDNVSYSFGPGLYGHLEEFKKPPLWTADGNGRGERI